MASIHDVPGSILSINHGWKRMRERIQEEGGRGEMGKGMEGWKGGGRDRRGRWEELLLRLLEIEWRIYKGIKRLRHRLGVLAL